ncbi:MAG: hypothetical protein IMW86_00195 [Hydrogenibacillus sp.]|nr:hypothetical protein [Hydrogenibacillus sp.]
MSAFSAFVLAFFAMLSSLVALALAVRAARGAGSAAREAVYAGGKRRSSGRASTAEAPERGSADGVALSSADVLRLFQALDELNEVLLLLEEQNRALLEAVWRDGRSAAERPQVRTDGDPSGGAVPTSGGEMPLGPAGAGPGDDWRRYARARLQAGGSPEDVARELGRGVHEVTLLQSLEGRGHRPPDMTDASRAGGGQDA